MAAVKVRVTNPMHGGDAEDINSPLAGDSTDLGDLDGLQQRPKRSTSPTLSPRPGEVLPPRVRARAGTPPSPPRLAAPRRALP